MELRKAVVTAAGSSQRMLPLQRLVDADGAEKSALQIIAEEITAAGIESIALVICPGDEDAYADAAGPLASHVTFVPQEDPRGYGDALLRAAAFVGDEPFLHLVGDHLYVSHEERRCAMQLVEIARREDCAVSAVQATREAMLPYYGAVAAIRRSPREALYAIENVIEKPTPTEAEQHLLVPGLRAGHYLCLFGMHVLPASIFELIREAAADDASASVQLSPALAALAQRERYLACELDGARYDIGARYGVLIAQLAIALAGSDRDEILAQLTLLLASRPER